MNFTPVILGLATEGLERLGGVNVSPVKWQVCVSLVATGILSVRSCSAGLIVSSLQKLRSGAFVSSLFCIVGT